MSKKVKFQFLGETFELPSNAVQYDKYDDNKPYIHMGAKHTASVIKQYVKKKYGNRITVWSTSDVYSGGSSVRVNVWSNNGSPTPLSIYEDIQNFGRQFKAGHFDGMYDIYEYRDDVVNSDNGTPFKYFPSYVFVENNPKWDSVEYWLKEWKNLDRLEQQGVKTWEEFLDANRTYMGKGIEDRLNKYMVELNKQLKKIGYTEEELKAA
jgi:hypothetical protein